MDIIKTRKSVRSYQDKPIPNEVLKRILDAGRLAPSWLNVQPWHFILVRKNKELLSELSGGQSHVKNAAALIVCVADKGAWNKDRFSKVLKQRGMNDGAIESIMKFPAFYPPLHGENTTFMRTVEQAAYAAAYITLEAEYLGIGACVIGGVGNEATLAQPELYQKVKKELNLNDEQCIISIITLGYPLETGETVKLRKDFDEVVSEEKLGEKFVF